MAAKKNKKRTNSHAAPKGRRVVTETSRVKSVGIASNDPFRLFQYAPGVPVYTAGTANRYNRIRHYKGWVYVAVRAIAEKISQLRPTVGIKRRTPPGKPKWLSKSMRERLKSTTMIREHEDIEPLEEDHPLALLLDDPNEPDTSADLWYRTILFWELTGIAYWWMPRNNAGMPCEIWVLPSHWVTPIGGGADRLVDHYRVTPYEGSYNTADIDADDIIAIKHPSPVSIVDGWSALDGGSAWVDQADSVDSARWYQMANAHNAGLVLQLDGSLDMPGKEDLDAAYAMLGERMRGPSKNRLPLILPPGWQSGGRFGMTAEELDYTGNMDQIRDMVLSLFRVPKGVLGIEPGVANTSAYAPNDQFYQYCINPKLQFMSQVLTEKLAKRRFDDNLYIYWHNAAPLDPQGEQLKWDNALKQGAVTYNEYRAGLMNMEPLEGFGDEPLIPSGMVPIPTGDTGVEPLLIGDGSQSRQQSAEQEAPTPTTVYQIIALQRAYTAGEIQRDAAIECAVSIGGVDKTTAEKLFPQKPPTQYFPRQIGTPPDDGNGTHPKIQMTDSEAGKKHLKNAVPDDAIKIELPDVRQETDYSCGASAFQAIAEMYGVGPEDESWYRDALDSDENEGTSPNNIRELADQLGLHSIAKSGMTADELKAMLDKRIPVMLLIQAWGDPATYGKDDNGHYVVAIGYTEDELIVEDPSLRMTRGYIAWEDLDKRWHDVGEGQKYDHWGMAITKPEVMRPTKTFTLNGNGKHLALPGQKGW